MGLNWCCAFSGFVAHLRNIELGGIYYFIVSGELVELGKVTSLLKVFHCKHNPEKWPQQFGPCPLGLSCKTVPGHSASMADGPS